MLVRFLIEWIEQHKVVELVIRENAHHELIPRCRPILQFLAQNSRIDETFLDNLWSWSYVRSPISELSVRGLV